VKIMGTWLRDRSRPLGIPWQTLSPHILERFGKRLSLNCSVWYCDEGSTVESGNNESSRVWEWRRYLKSNSASLGEIIFNQRKLTVVNVSIVMVKLYQDTEGAVSERSSAFQMGRFGSRHTVRACSEHKRATIFKMGSIVCDFTWKCYL